MTEMPGDLDEQAIRDVLREHPVAFAILFGSYARGQQSMESDVDIAVAFDESVADEDRLAARIRLIVEISDRLETDDVDVADLASIDPSVGKHAMRTGRLLVGKEPRRQEYLNLFEEASPPAKTHRERMARLRDIVDRLEAQL